MARIWRKHRRTEDGCEGEKEAGDYERLRARGQGPEEWLKGNGPLPMDRTDHSGFREGQSKGASQNILRKILGNRTKA